MKYLGKISQVVIFFDVFFDLLLAVKSNWDQDAALVWVADWLIYMKFAWCLKVRVYEEFYF